MRHDDNVQVVSGNILIGEVAEHRGDKGRCPVVHVQSRLSLREPIFFYFIFFLIAKRGVGGREAEGGGRGGDGG